jgi:hypothetical protein
VPTIIQLSESTALQLDSAADVGAAMVGINRQESPASIVDAINNYTKTVIRTDAKVPRTELISLGALLGFQYLRQFGWNWFEIDYGGGDSAVAVLNGDQSLGNQPLNWIFGVVNEHTEINFLLNFNMVATGSVPIGMAGDPTMFN